MQDLKNIPVGTFRFPADPANIVTALQFAPAYEYLSIKDIISGANFILAEDASVFMIFVNSKEDLFQLAMLVKEVKHRGPIVKIVVVTPRSNVFDKALTKLGIGEVIDSNSSAKMIRYKVDLWTKSLRAQLKKKQGLAPLKSNEVDSGAALELRAAEHSLIWQEALSTEADMWLLRSEADCRKVMTKWLVRILGPSPYVGRWVDAPKIGGWEFKFKTEVNPYNPPGAKWYFRGGQKPEFVWKDNLWLLASESFSLYCEHKGEVFTRISLKSRVLTIARNSVHATSKEAALLESFNKDLLLVKPEEAEGEEFLDPRFTKRFEYLKGKNQAEGPIDGHLYGKQKHDRLAKLRPLPKRSAPPIAGAEAPVPKKGRAEENETEKQVTSKVDVAGNLSGKGEEADRISTFLGMESRAPKEKAAPSSKDQKPRDSSSPPADPELESKAKGTDHLSTFLGRNEKPATPKDPHTAEEEKTQPEDARALDKKVKEQKELTVKEPREPAARAAGEKSRALDEKGVQASDKKSDPKKITELDSQGRDPEAAKKNKTLSERDPAVMAKTAVTPADKKSAEVRPPARPAKPLTKASTESQAQEAINEILEKLATEAAASMKRSFTKEALSKDSGRETPEGIAPERSGKKLPESADSKSAQSLKDKKLFAVKKVTDEAREQSLASVANKSPKEILERKSPADQDTSPSEATKVKTILELLPTLGPELPSPDMETAKRLKVLYEKAAKQYMRG